VPTLGVATTATTAYGSARPLAKTVALPGTIAYSTVSVARGGRRGGNECGISTFAIPLSNRREHTQHVFGIFVLNKHSHFLGASPEMLCVDDRTNRTELVARKVSCDLLTDRLSDFTDRESCDSFDTEVFVARHVALRRQ